MKLEFGKDTKGFGEAEHLLRITRQLGTTPETDRVRLELERHALDHLAHDDVELARVQEVLAMQSRALMARLARAWRRFWGPSSVEVELSRQRIDALERADRAERSSFESFAEMARMGRERDEAIEDLKVLQQQLDNIENANRK